MWDLRRVEIKDLKLIEFTGFVANYDFHRYLQWVQKLLEAQTGLKLGIRSSTAEIASMGDYQSQHLRFYLSLYYLVWGFSYVDHVHGNSNDRRTYMTYFVSILPETALFIASFFFVDAKATPPCLDQNAFLGDRVFEAYYPDVFEHRKQITLFFSAPCNLWSADFAHQLLVFLKHQLYVNDAHGYHLRKTSSLAAFYKEVDKDKKFYSKHPYGRQIQQLRCLTKIVAIDFTDREFVENGVNMVFHFGVKTDTETLISNVERLNDPARRFSVAVIEHRFLEPPIQ
jgi:hypothetical protein